MRMFSALAVATVSSLVVALRLETGMASPHETPREAASAVDSVYLVTPIEVPGADLTSALDITDAGIVVGSYGRDSITSFGFVHDGKQFITVQYPGAPRTRVTSMGADGTLVGAYSMEPGRAPTIAWRPFLRRPSGEFVLLRHNDHPYGIALRVLDDGTVLGCLHSTDMTTTMRGMLYTRGRVNSSDLVSSHRGASQDGRRIVASVFGDARGYLLEGERVTYIERPGAAVTETWAINDAGTIVGAVIDSAKRSRAFVREGGRWTTLDIPGSTSDVAFGINQRGDVVGAMVDATGRRRGFIARRVQR